MDHGQKNRDNGNSEMSVNLNQDLNAEDEIVTLEDQELIYALDYSFVHNNSLPI